ncbi:MAG: NAD(P)/FAD-dependent oxidoreductase, partial [Rhodoferax sp.]
YEIDSSRGTVRSSAVVVATGGLSIPQIGASDLGYQLARQFDLPIVTPRPALVPLVFDARSWTPFADLAGLSLPVHIETGSKKDRVAFLEDLLFTHRGLSGPAVLQISSYWKAPDALRINLAPTLDLAERLAQAKAQSRKLLSNELATLLPTRLANTWIAQGCAWGQQWQGPINEVSDKSLNVLARHLGQWELTPTGSEGFKKAEVTAGGVDTRALSGQTMESRQPGLYFIGEVLDVTGWLGGYNFQWAWASGFACAQALAAKFRAIAPTPSR